MKTDRRQFIRLLGLGPAALFDSGKKEAKKIRPQLARISSPYQPSAWIELNLGHLDWNLSRLRSHVKTPILAVIKANAYGHGLTEIGHLLFKKRIDALMVGNFQEAVRLHEKGISCPIHNFGPASSIDPDWLIQNGISQSVFTNEVSELNSSALRLSKKVKVHIHIDTGMGRMGIPFHQAPPYIEKVISLPGVEIAGISTTLTEDPDFDSLQLKRFLQISALFEKKGIPLGFKHAASSAAVLEMPAAHLDMIRPGIILYGYYPSQKTQAQNSLRLKPVLQLKCRVAAQKNLRPGDSVSYHRAYVAQKKVSIAVLPVGYSDGYPAGAVSRGHVLIRGESHPLIASITANHMHVLMTKGIRAEPGEEAVLLGKQGNAEISAVDIAQWTGQSVYKILLSLNPLLPRKIYA